jgi:integrase
MNYPKKEGKCGPIYQVAEGISVTPNEWGSWLLILRRGSERKKKAFGKTEEGLSRALKAAELLAARLGLTLMRQGDRTFGQVAQEWLEINDSRWQSGTKERYVGIVREYLRPLHQLPLDRVDRSRIKRLLAEMLKIRAPKTVELTYAVISGIFSEANDLGYTDQNPAQGLLKKVLPPKSKRALKEPDPLTRQDLEKFMQAAWEKLPGQLGLVLEVMAMTGMRLGEALAMRRDNLDAANGQYLITETVRKGYGKPKSGKRLIDLEAGLVPKLESHIKKLRQQSLAAGTEVNYLFSGLTQRLVQGAMRRACLAAKLRVRHPSAAYLCHALAHGPLQPGLCSEAVGPPQHQYDRGHLRPLDPGRGEKGPGENSQGRQGQAAGHAAAGSQVT